MRTQRLSVGHHLDRRVRVMNVSFQGTVHVVIPHKAPELPRVQHAFPFWENHT